ncbi:hypothetical protein [Breznakiella homolactica]|uniref:Uncharacterized protein n=1 Tax=Breznakiella homolactica TaxID=2798577 RepID=A0A7T7XPH0_9SPIR|nr:hypothetical protein [Breznakiella homolactica]QQO10091.1 hypothetical protein JFL75_04010 [Breznakiella homolactica]
MPETRRNWINILNAYKEKLSDTCSVEVLIGEPAGPSQNLQVNLIPIPHPVISGNGRIRLRLRALLQSGIPGDDTSISHLLDTSLLLAGWFSETQGGIRIADNLFAVAYHHPLRNDDESYGPENINLYSYDERWLVELEFNYEAAVNAVSEGV